MNAMSVKLQCCPCSICIKRVNTTTVCVCFNVNYSYFPKQVLLLVWDKS